MKRMYVVLACMFAIVFWAGALLGQGQRPVDNPTDAFEKRMKMREEMHRRMIDKLLHGIGPDQDMFTDMEEMLDEVMKDSFSLYKMNGMGATAAAYQSEWKESAAGRTLEITLSKPDQHLDISIERGMITIKGKGEEKRQNGNFVSSFSSSISVPSDCDAGKVKMDQKNGKILVFFPYLKGSKPIEVRPKKDQRIPLPPSETDVQI